MRVAIKSPLIGSNCMKTVRSTKGFTLIELMIVVVIIGILAALAIPRFTGASKAAKQAEAEPILKQMYTMEQAYYARQGRYTTSLNDLREIGWEEPTNLQYFGTPTIPTASETALKVQMQTISPDLKAACIDQTGKIVKSTTVGTGGTC